MVSLAVGGMLGSALQVAWSRRTDRAILLATIATVEFGFLVTGTRKVEWLLFISSAVGLLFTALRPPPKVLASLTYWICLVVAVYYFGACLLEAARSGVPFTFGSLLGPVLAFGLSLLIYLVLRFVLSRGFLQALLNQIQPFRSGLSFGIAAGTALGLFYVIPIIQGFIPGGGLVSVALGAVHYMYCLWVLAKSLLPASKSMLALSLALSFALTVVGVGETVDPAFNSGRLVGMAIIGFSARSIGVFPWPRTIFTTVLWMTFWYLVVSVVLAGRLEPGSALYPGGPYEENWPLLVTSISALAFGFGISSLVGTFRVAAPTALAAAR